MAISIDIIPLSTALDMYGEPDTSSAYSLSGHVAISLSSPFSLFERRRAVRLLLQSLVIVFEGQSELVTPHTGYSALRLCSIDRELLSNEPVELSNDGLEDSDKPCTWNVTFNLPIPGWLPATDTFGDCRQTPPGTRYALYATARFADADGSQSSSWLPTFCTSFLPKTKEVHATACDIILNRFAIPPSMPASTTSTYPMTNFRVGATTEDAQAPRDPATSIPLDILSKIQVVPSVPQHIDISQNDFAFSLRLRAPELAESDSAKVRITEFSVEVDQQEKFQNSSTAYATRFPVPKPHAQPPFEHLRNPHPVHTLYDLGLMSSDTQEPTNIIRTFSLLPPDISAYYRLIGHGCIFSRTAGIEPSSWYTMQTTIPFASPAPKHGTSAWPGGQTLRPSGQTPFFSVKHSLTVSVLCAYETADGAAPLSERLRFTLPLNFVRTRAASPAATLVAGMHVRSESEATVSSVPSGSPQLPAYSQLFHANGDRKVDESVQLPRYSPPPSPSTDGERNPKQVEGEFDS